MMQTEKGYAAMRTQEEQLTTNLPRTSSTGTTTTTTSTTSNLVNPSEIDKNGKKNVDSAVLRLQIQEITSQYYECLLAPMPSFVARRVLMELQEGVPASYFMYALEEAAMAPRPSWRYATAIVRRLVRERASTEDLLSTRGFPV